MSNQPSNELMPLCDGEVRLVYEHGEPHGVRDTTGYLCFFHRVSKWPGQEERYRQELALRARQAEAIAAALRGGADGESTRQSLHQVTAAYDALLKRMGAVRRDLGIDPHFEAVAEIGRQS